MKVLFGQNPRDFEQSLGQILTLQPISRDLGYFPNNEFSLNLDLNGKDTILVIPSYTPAIHEYMMEAQVLCYSAKKAGARKVVLLLPYLPYSRQDQGLRLGHFILHQLSTAGADIILTIDVHNPDLLVSFPICKNITISPVFAQDIQERFSSSSVILIAPDKGSFEKVSALGQLLSVPCLHLSKTRHLNQVTFAPIEANLQGKVVLLIDDMIDTATTMVKAAYLIQNCGAQEIHGYGTHGVLSSPAHQVLLTSPLTSLTLTNTLPIQDPLPFLRIINAAWIIAQPLQEIMIDEGE